RGDILRFRTPCQCVDGQGGRVLTVAPPVADPASVSGLRPSNVIQRAGATAKSPQSRAESGDTRMRSTPPVEGDVARQSGGAQNRTLLRVGGEPSVWADVAGEEVCGVANPRPASSAHSASEVERPESAVGIRRDVLIVAPTV